MMKRLVNLGLIQMTCQEDIETNFDKLILICTQELFKSPYFCQVENPDHFDLAEVIDESSPTIQKLGVLASELKIISLMIPTTTKNSTLPRAI